jgi:hypothetical protein
VKFEVRWLDGPTENKELATVEAATAAGAARKVAIEFGLAPGSTLQVEPQDHSRALADFLV